MRYVNWGMLVVVAACSAEDHVAPAWREPAAPAQATLVPPDYKYVGTVYPFEGNFNDVNDRGLVVGMGNFRAIAMQLGGPVTALSGGRFREAEAHAVNAFDMIVGTVYKGQWRNSDGSPAIWSTVGATPMVLKELGSANDLNDAGFVVGTIVRGGLSYGFGWDSVTRVIQVLPPLKGGKQTTAVAVNNDRIILGFSEDGFGGWTSVTWQYNGTAWTPRQINGLTGSDIDHGYGVVGRASNRAAYGFPHFAGYLGTSSDSYANRIASNGLIAGFDPGATLGWPSYGRGFVADRNGAVSYMPDPLGGNMWRHSEVRAVNACGVAVGFDWPLPAPTFTQQPVVWNPGC